MLQSFCFKLKCLFLSSIFESVSMATQLAGKVLGPRPGKAICSFWQGNVEMVLRVMASVVGSVPALVAAAIALAGLSSGDISLVPESTETGSLGAAGYAILCAGLGIAMELLLIIVRILNIGLINLKVNLFLITDVMISILLAVGHFAGGVVTAFFASQGSESQVKNGLAASAVFCLLAVLLYSFLAGWSILFIINNWNKKVVSYTLKDAITG